MKFWDIIKLWVRENLLLFKDTEKFRAVVTLRLIAFVILVITFLVVYQVYKGFLKFDIGFVVGLFAIFISSLFFWTSRRIQDEQMTHLRNFLNEMRQESARGFQQLESVFKGSQVPPPDDQSIGGLSEDYAQALSDAMAPYVKQLIIALHETDRPLPINKPIHYSYEHGNSRGTGGILLISLMPELNSAELLKYANGSRNACLTSRGKLFAEWLVDKGQKASYFESPQLTKWGQASSPFPMNA